MVVGAVPRVLVSVSIFTVYREKTGNFSRKGDVRCQTSTRKSRVVNDMRLVSRVQEQGIQFAITGKRRCPVRELPIENSD
jgi:hypothetical protein